MFVMRLLTLSTFSSLVKGHGFLKTPRSRNYVAHEDGTWASEAGVPMRETCPHCLNSKEADKVCGKGNARTDYDDWNDSVGNKIQWASQGVYEEGDVFTVESVLTTNHAGHMEIWLCPDVDNPSQECFESNPATLIEDVAHNGPVHAEYPERAYFAAGDANFKFTYKLPDGLVGDQVLIQWKYITANSCFPPGYKDSSVTQVLQDLNWLRSWGMDDCTYPYSRTGDRDNGSPEQFWNCAEISIYPKGSLPPHHAPSTQPPVPAPATTAPQPAPFSAPQPAPVSQPTPSSSPGYCNWGTTGTSANSVCDGNVEGGPWCNESESRCNQCGGNWCTNGSEPTPTPPAPTPTPPGMATTTRYWDCSGGACGCAYLSTGQPTHCHSNAMFAAPTSNPYGASYYGTAAVSPILFSPSDMNKSWLGEGCGKCWKVTGTANLSGFDTTTTTTLVLKGANVCPADNAACSGGKAHFDIAAPGFDVTAYSLANTCETREAAEKDGFAACGDWMISQQDPTKNCDCSKFTDPVLRNGCENFLALNWDNAQVAYEEVTCPSELDRLNCWEENNNNYPFGIPDFCAANVDGTAPTMTSSPTRSPTSKPSLRPSLRATSSPTLSPVKNPTSTPPPISVSTIMPTPNPTPDPTPNPTPGPTAAPPTGGNTFCCSDNLIACKQNDNYCNASKGNCEGNCASFWVADPGISTCRIARYDDCTKDVTGCCPPATCQGNQYYRQCNVW